MSSAYAFDLGNTLYPESRAVEEALRTFSVWLVAEAIGYTAASFRAAYERSLWAEGSPTRTQRVFGDVSAFTRTFEALDLGYLTPSQGLERYRKFLLRRLRPDRKARGAFRFLKAQGGRIAVCTHHPADLALEVLRRLGLRAFVDELVSSADSNLEKGSDAFFAAVSGGLGVLPRDTRYFGDDEIEDGGCIRAGMSFVHVSAYEDPEWKHSSGIPYPATFTVSRIDPRTVGDLLSASI